ncbi:MAG: hemerythrin domain-containing protein [Nitrospira sp.]|nr:hemerythrin domain-containing protein [Nitrospira sp.]
MPKHDSGQAKAKASSKKKPTDAIQILQEDHRKVEKLFDRFLEADGKRRQQIAQQIFQELEVHSTLEEEIFYPALQNQVDSEERTPSRQSETLDEGEETVDAMKHDDTEPKFEEENEGPDEATQMMIATAYDEHRAVRDMIAQLKQKDASSPDYHQSMTELQQAVVDHVTTEEDEMFPEAQLSLDIKALGKRMQQRKREILSAAA